MQALPRSLFFDVDGPVHVADHGGPAEAPTVVAVHGLAGSSSQWGPLAQSLSGTCRLLAVDLPGHGRSPAMGRPVGVTDAAVVLQEVLGHLDVGPVTLVGHSMGAVAAVLAAQAAPESIERLLLLAPPMPRQGLDLVSPAVLPHVALCLWPRLGAAALRRRMSRLTIEEYVRQGLRLTCASVPEMPELAAALAAEMRAAYEAGEDPVVHFIEAARSVGFLVADGRRYRDALAGVQAPTQVVHGRLDRVLRPSSLAQLARLQPDWQTELLPDVGHSPHMEAPGAVARLLAGRAATTTLRRTIAAPGRTGDAGAETDDRAIA